MKSIILFALTSEAAKEFADTNHEYGHVYTNNTCSRVRAVEFDGNVSEALDAASEMVRDNEIVLNTIPA